MTSQPSLETMSLPHRAISYARALLRQSQFVRFILVGLINTVVGYVLFLAALALIPGTTPALLVSTIAAVLFNFVSTGNYVFRSTDPARLWRFVGVYGLVFAYNALALATLERHGVPPQVGGLLALPGAVLISFLSSRAFVFAGTR